MPVARPSRLPSSSSRLSPRSSTLLSRSQKKMKKKHQTLASLYSRCDVTPSTRLWNQTDRLRSSPLGTLRPRNNTGLTSLESQTQLWIHPRGRCSSCWCYYHHHYPLDYSLLLFATSLASLARFLRLSSRKKNSKTTTTKKKNRGAKPRWRRSVLRTIFSSYSILRCFLRIPFSAKRTSFETIIRRRSFLCSRVFSKSWKKKGCSSKCEQQRAYKLCEEFECLSLIGGNGGKSLSS